jgi:hypothetical protein
MFHQGRLLKSRVMHGMKKASGMIQACLAGLMYTLFFSKIEIFLLALADSFSIFQLSKHASLSFSHMITYHLSTFLQANAMHRVCVTRFSAKWSGLLGEKILKELKAQAQATSFPSPLPHLITYKHYATQAMYAHWEHLKKDHKFSSHIPPPSSILLNPTPIHLGILHKYHKNGQKLYSAVTQAISGHRFFQEYSSRFCPTTNNNIFCPCHALPP